MIGAIIGDIAGSRFEGKPPIYKKNEFALFAHGCRPTDDSIMTVAVGKAILDCEGDYAQLAERAIERMQELGRLFPHCGFARRFKDWIFADNPEPYNSFGNGSAMRVSGAGWAASSLEEAKELSYKVTAVSHNHPEGIKGAEAVAVAIWLAREGKSKEEIKTHISENYYDMERTIDEICNIRGGGATCQKAVPLAFLSFFDAESFEDTVRTAASLGVDSDTLAAIAGSIAEAFYGAPLALREGAESYLKTHKHMIVYEWLKEFEEKFGG